MEKKLKEVELTNNVNYRIVNVKIVEIGFVWTDVRLTVELFDRETGVLLDTITVKALGQGFDTSDDWYYFIEQKVEEGFEFEKDEDVDIDYYDAPDEIKEEFDNYVNDLYEEYFNDPEYNYDFNFKFFINEYADMRCDVKDNLEDCDYLDYYNFYYIEDNTAHWVNIDKAELIGYNGETKNEVYKSGDIYFEEENIDGEFKLIDKNTTNIIYEDD